MATAREVAEAVDRPVNRLGTRFMAGPSVLQAGTDAGYAGWAWYHGGRGGPLGDVGPEVVHAAFVFFPFESVRKGWEKARAVAEPRESGRRYAEALAGWGREHLPGVDGGDETLRRLGDLVLRVVDAADGAGLPLFAAWRALERPEDPAGRALHALQLLRELRGGLHALVVLAEGMTPLEAVVSGPAGTDNAKFFSWPEPYPDPSTLVEARRRVDERSAALAVRPFEALDDAEGDELVALVRAVRSHVTARPVEGFAG